MGSFDDARNRLITAALRVAAAERGGLDHANSDTELELAYEILDAAIGGYVQTRGGLSDRD